jgi:hypothetical protein
MRRRGRGGGYVLGSVVLSRKSKLALNDTDLGTYFFNQLGRMSCPNIKCGCLAIVREWNAPSAVAKYLTWFERQQKHKQDSIVFEWWRYVLIFKASNKQKKTDGIDDKVRRHLVCRCGLNTILTFGERRYKSIQKAAMFLSVLPDHKSIGKKNYNAVEYNDRVIGHVLMAGNILARSRDLLNSQSLV